jgi:PIN domain nuclease of toxin-antitoxin system
VKLLLDTHVWLWMVSQPDRLSAHVAQLLSDADVQLHLSSASSWEMAIKYQLGKLPLPEAPVHFIPPRLVRDNVRPLPIDHSHALALADLPPHHRDPFDRILVAQAQVENLTLVTADKALTAYDVTLLLN